MRRPSRSTAAAAAVLLAAALCGAARASEAVDGLADGQTIRFEVSDADSGKLLYSGFEQIRLDGGVVRKDTVYRTPAGSEVMTESVSYDSDSLRVNDFVSRHPEIGEKMELRREGKQLSIEYVPSSGSEPQRNEQLVWGPDTRIGKTIHHIVVRHWDELIDGKAISFDLLVPSKFDTYGFRLVEQPRAGDGDRVFRLEPESWFVRQFVTPMDFHYDERKLATKYVGPTTVEYYQNPDQRVVIRFSY